MVDQKNVKRPSRDGGLRADASNVRHDTIVVPETGVCAAAYAAGMVGATPRRHALIGPFG